MNGVLLYAPGNNPELMRKAPGKGPDVVVFDLEDAIPGDEKESARHTLKSVLSSSLDPVCDVCIRINSGAVGREDMALIFDDCTVQIDYVMIPMVESRSDVTSTIDFLTENGISLPLVAMIETARGVEKASDIAGIAGLEVLAFGPEDLTANLGAMPRDDRRSIQYARDRVLLAAKSNDLVAIDGSFTKLDDPDTLEMEAETAKDLGYDGKAAIHPDQIPVIRSGFRPSSDELDWARRVLEVAGGSATATGVFRVDGQMVDEPLLKQAERILWLEETFS